MISTKGNPFGQVISISGMNLIIELNKELLQRNLEQQIIVGEEVNKMHVGIVGDIFLIGDLDSNNIHFGIFEEVKLVTSYENPTSTGGQIEEPSVINERNKAIAIAKIIGYQDKSINDYLKFQRGIGHYPRFNSKCYLLNSDEKKSLFSLSDGQGIKVGNVAGIQSEEVAIHIDKFLGKHSVILGSTGSGKSSTVASILQKILREYQYSHILFFDLHDEYSAAFNSEEFSERVNKIKSSTFKLPYWLLNFEEFQSIFLGDMDSTKNSDGIRILKEKILELKEKEHTNIKEQVGDIDKISINSPIYFDVDMLLDELTKLNRRTFWKSDNELAFNEDGTDYLTGTGSTKIERPGKDKDQVIQDPNYYGKLNQVIEKIQSIKNDRRFAFLFQEDVSNSLFIKDYLLNVRPACA